MFVQLDIAVGDVVDDFVGHFRHFLSLFALETILHQPLTHKFLGQLALRFAFGEFLFVTVGIEIAGRVGGMNLVDEVDFAVGFAELVLGIHQNQAFLGGDFTAALEQCHGVFLQNGIIFGRNEAASQDFLLGNILRRR